MTERMLIVLWDVYWFLNANLTARNVINHLLEQSIFNHLLEQKISEQHTENSES